MCQGEAPPMGDYKGLQMHREQQAGDVGNGYACTKTYCYACICAWSIAKYPRQTLL